MFTTPPVIASIYTAIILLTGACIGYGLGQLAAWPIVAQLRDQLADAAWQLAHDPLTGIYNRHGLRTAHAAFAAAHPAQPVVAILIDLDGFKEINDEHGHGVGDEVLIEIAKRLTPIAAFFGGDVARHSGDEYAALFPVRQRGIAQIADALLAAIATPVKIQADTGPVVVALTASIGLAVVDSSDPFEDVALHRADIAMYHAKRSGRNQHTLYTPGMTMPASDTRRGPRLRDLHHQHSEAEAA
ncbi:GGDEF domain-containing protein [Catellatospora tritici]|uniref:GGDEF domain-containing protein n=1 Tax=Catellatospora tritici TaxID=2851566 RepID=UPI001C2DA21F|nr:GGDEF domain-containing protein [Catellatospora tritici]MBV1854556.1 GGDEF domain-containing protein [Catellatospora tritici]